MSSTKVAAGSTKIIVSPSNNDDSFGIMQPTTTTTTTTTIQPTNADVLCGRGSGIRRHPGNEFYNRLLRENYEKYKSAPKGNKVSIVKKILMLVKQNEGRFLERTTTTSCQNGSSSYQYLYTELGDERALNKTAQAFRDIRATMEKHHSPSFKRSIRGNTKSSTTPATSPSIRTPGRPTFRERLAMLEREQQWKKVGNENSDDDDENDDDKSEEEQVSDTETEDSFPINE